MSSINFVASIVSRVVSMLTSFVGRSIFVRVLSSEYLGLGGFFGNVFSIVSLCELGLGSAISQSLYKPLANRDEYKISAILSYFSKVYKWVAIASLSISLAAMPLLPHITKAQIDMKTVCFAYVLFCVHLFLSYLLSPKVNLVICDQRMYVVTIARSLLNVAGLVMQTMVLIYTRNYLLYLAIRIIMLFLGDVFVNMYADKKYPFIARFARVDKKYIKRIKKAAKALMWHRVGGVLSRNTDSLLLTYFIGLAGMGKYSNYALFIGTIGAFFDAAANASAASVGNLGSHDRSDKAEAVMRKIYFINFFILTVGTSVIICTLTPFIELWLGKNMLFSELEMIVIVISFYFSCIRDPVQIFISAFGLFNESKFIPIMRAASNLIFSVILVQKIGVSGVFLGTILSTALVPLPLEVYVLYKYGFNKKCTPFVKEMCKYIYMSFFSFFACYTLTLRIKHSIIGLLIRIVISLFCSAVMLVFAYGKDERYLSAKETVFKILKG